MLKNYKSKYLLNDIFTGIIIALVSIPMGLGYAQVAGLPVVYGLYGSLLPILFYGLIASSPQFIFGVDAAPAALVGGAVAAMGIAAGSPEAVRVIPVITFITGCWLLIFFVFKAGRLVNYISKPVMGGFITGIGATIILMQVPKLFGGKSGTGELFELLWHIIEEFKNINLLSMVLGIGTVIIILLMKKAAPKFPMSVFMMVLGVAATVIFKIDRFGVPLLPSVEPGLPTLKWMDFTVISEYGMDIIVTGLTTALVILASTLLSVNNFAMKYNYKVNNGREILAYSAATFASSVVGCCPVNGSVSRTGMAVQLGSKSQLTSVFASVTMAVVLLVGTPMIKYMPVPVLTGIVIAALFGILELQLAKKLWGTDKSEFMIFMMACFGVLVFGTIYGVLIGIILSFIAMIVKAVVPPKAYLGVIPGQEGFYSLKRNRRARQIKNTVVYRFSGTLFFANINTFVDDIENAVKPGIKNIIVDASGITNVDITAADRLVILYENLRAQGIRFYLTEHVCSVNDQLRTLGAEVLVEKGAVRRTVSLALRDAGFDKPYPLEDNGMGDVEEVIETNEHLAEFEWAFGEDADKKMEELVAAVVKEIAGADDSNSSLIEEAENKVAAFWGRIGLYDEDELLDRLEMHLSELAQSGHDADTLEERIEQRRELIESKLSRLNPDAVEMLKKHRHDIAMHFKEKNPAAYEHMIERRKEHIAHLEKNNPRLAEKFKHLYEHEIEHGIDQEIK